MSTNLNKVFKTELAKLTEREFDPNETLRLLILTNPTIWFTWGVERKINFENRGLLLKVNGNLHQSWVLITLEYRDLFSVRIFDDIRVIKHHLTGIYFDQLQQVIDEKIEKIDDYNF